jgi:hypothetical protein
LKQKGVNAIVDQVGSVDYTGCKVANADGSYCGHMMVSSTYVFLTQTNACQEGGYLVWQGSGADGARFMTKPRKVETGKTQVTLEIENFKWTIVRDVDGFVAVNFGGCLIRVINGVVPSNNTQALEIMSDMNHRYPDRGGGELIVVFYSDDASAEENGGNRTVTIQPIVLDAPDKQALKTERHWIVKEPSHPTHYWFLEIGCGAAALATRIVSGVSHIHQLSGGTETIDIDKNKRITWSAEVEDLEVMSEPRVVVI